MGRNKEKSIPEEEDGKIVEAHAKAVHDIPTRLAEMREVAHIAFVALRPGCLDHYLFVAQVFARSKSHFAPGDDLANLLPDVVLVDEVIILCGFQESLLPFKPRIGYSFAYILVDRGGRNHRDTTRRSTLRYQRVSML